jgi:hypothetical protein
MLQRHLDTHGVDPNTPDTTTHARRPAENWPQVWTFHTILL